MTNVVSESNYLRQLIEGDFSVNLQTIILHCTELSKLLQRDDSEEVLDDLGVIMDSAKLLSSKLDNLQVEGLPDNLSSRGQTLAKLRHDLRTPLNAIFGYAEIIAETVELPENSPLQMHHSAILAAATSLLKTIDRIAEGLSDDSLPITLQTKADSEISHQLQRINQYSNANRPTGHILVVDDVEQNRLLLRRQLTAEGHRISLADSGAAAISMIARQEFDLILLDIMMPDVNGLEVLQTLKKSERYKKIPIIVISGLGDIDAIAPCIAAGAEDYLTKPFNRVLLQARINSSLQKKMWIDKEQDYIAQIEQEKKRTDAIMQAVLPSAVIDRLKVSDEPIADRFENVTVMFADIVGFTAAAENMTPEEVLSWLDSLFSEFDRFTVDHGVEKIKTIGDAYMVACGAPSPKSDHVDRVLEFARSILLFINKMDRSKSPFRLRIGVHAGPVVAGLVGQHRYVYDLWGETVNIASRIEASGIENRISVSSAIVEQASARFSFEDRGLVELKGIGSTKVFMLSA